MYEDESIFVETNETSSEEVDETPETETPLLCACCGEVIDPNGYTEENCDGDVICEDCYDNNYFTCPACDSVTSNDDSMCVNSGTCHEETICSDCAANNSNYFRCDDCGNYFSNRYLSMSDDDTNICDDCSGDWARCNDCGLVARTGGMSYSENDRNWYCEDCYRDNDHDEDCDDWIHNYSFKPNPNFLKCADEAAQNFFMGVELEIDEGSDRYKCAADLNELGRDESLFYLKEDGSLGNSGIEIVTHPATLNYHLNSFPWTDIAAIARQHAYHSHDAGTCGLHVHVSRKALGADTATQEATIAKIILMVDRFWDKLSVFSRRNLDRSQWAQKPNADIKQGDLLPVAIQKAKGTNTTRYHAVNLQNYNTIEFRIFRGTLNVDTIKATLQLVNNLCYFAKRDDLRRCLGAKWKTVVNCKKYPELEAYLASRHLNTNDIQRPVTD